MEAIHVTATIAEDGRLHIDTPCGLPPGQAEGVLVISSAAAVVVSPAQRLDAVRTLALLDLPVADVATMNLEATPGPDELLP